MKKNEPDMYQEINRKFESIKWQETLKIIITLA